MKWKIVTIAACAVLLAAGIGAAVLDQGQPLPHRYLQHEESQQLADLSEEDRAAASSTSTDPATFASHLPVVSIDVGGQTIPDGSVHDDAVQARAAELGVDPESIAYDDERRTVDASVSVFDSQESANRLSDEPTIESDCTIRVRGNTSRSYDKKNYMLVLTNPDGTDNDQPLLGMDSCETWVLHGPAIDKTLIRNYLAYNIVGEFVASFVPEARFFELFIDGEYKGVYVAIESIKVEEGRLELNEPDQNDVETSYIVAIDERSATDTTLDDFLNYTGRLSNYLEIVYPNEEDLTEERKAAIEADISAWEKALFSYDYDTPSHGYWNYFDVDSFVDLYVFNEFVINDDYGAFSTYLYKDVRGLVTCGPVWDYDNTFDNYTLEVNTDEFYLAQRAWYNMLLKDERFCEDVIDRYRELREGPLSEEHILSYIDGAISYLGPAVERNWSVWEYTFAEDSYLAPENRRPLSFSEAIDDLKTFVIERGDFLDEHIENLRQYSHESAVKRYNH